MRSGTRNAAALVHRCWRRHTLGLLLRGWRASTLTLTPVSYTHLTLPTKA